MLSWPNERNGTRINDALTTTRFDVKTSLQESSFIPYFIIIVCKRLTSHSQNRGTELFRNHPKRSEPREGLDSDQANAMLTRDYRPPFVVPKPEHV